MSAQKSPNIVHPDDDSTPKQPGSIIKQTAAPVRVRVSSLKKVFKSRKRVALIIIAVLTVIVLAVGLNIYTSNNSKKKDQEAAFNEMIKLADTAESRSQHDIAKNLLLGFLAKYPNNQNKDEVNKIYSELGAIYTNQKDYKNAIEAQTKALQSAPKLTFAQYFSLAQVCEHSGDKTCAINNYKLALTRINEDVIASSQEPYKTYIAAHIKMLGS